MYFKKIKSNFLILVIIFLALVVRLYGINWDSGYHFHPDERMLIMVTERIEFFENINPDFFNYGSLPIYTLAAVGQIAESIFNSNADSYDGLLPIGRFISTINDLIVIFLIYKISFLLFRMRTISLWATFFYAISFFPIQNSHFFIVDTFLNLFITLLIYLILCYRENPSYKNLLLMGIVYAAALTTKVTPIIFLPVIFLAISLPHLSHENIFQKISHFFQNQKHALLSTIAITTIHFSFFSLITVLFTLIFMPYAYINQERFINDVMQQIQMNSNPYVFPYTLQYIDTTPYIYYLKNIFLWGMGPVISTFGLIGFSTYILLSFIRIPESSFFKLKSYSHLGYKLVTSKVSLLIIFYIIYFVIIGKSSVKFMRYMLLMYPFFAIWAGYGVFQFLKLYQSSGFSIFFSRVIIIILTIVWTLPFLNIYSTKSTRIQATDWINKSIPVGSTLAVEHWDDRVPIHDPGKFNYEELTLYDIPDSDKKWEKVNEKLDRSDYIVIASNRLYIPLQRLEECGNHQRCYPLTAEYYRKLFAGDLDFIKIAEFTSYPRLRVGDWQIKLIDDQADESFTVYDHPKIMVFKKIK